MKYSPYKRKQPVDVHAPHVQRLWKNKRGRFNVTVKRGCVAYTIICNAESEYKATLYANELIKALKGAAHE